MRSPPDAARPESRRLRLLLGLTTAGLGALSVLVVSQFPDRIFAGDPAAYRMRMEAILEGGLPYLDVPFEHLPVMLLPMGGAWYLGGSASQSAYIVIFAGLMTLTMATIAPSLDALGDRLGVRNAGRRWLVLVLPILPLVVFRNDPLAVLLTVIAMLMLADARRSWWLWAVAGAFAKVWSAVLALADWPRRKGVTAFVACSGLLSLLVTQMEGFTTAREAVGLHAETLIGAIVGLSRTITGQVSGVVVTTAAYLPLDGWVVAANSVVGVLVAVAGVLAVMVAPDLRTRFAAGGALVAGVILSSPLFSLQYVLWLTPFVALSSRQSTRLLGFLMGLVTILIASVWTEAALESPIFYVAITVRNVLVVAVAFLLVAESIGPGGKRSQRRIGSLEH